MDRQTDRQVRQRQQGRSPAEGRGVAVLLLRGVAVLLLRGGEWLCSC